MATPSLLPPRYTVEDKSIWEEEPVSPEEFFKTFIREPFFPAQQEFVDAMMGKSPQDWDTLYTEGIALWGKGSGKDRTAAKILVYVCYKLLCMKNPMAYLSAGADDETSVNAEDKLEVANVCINSRLAKEVFFKYFTILIRATKNPKTGKNWFVEKGLNFYQDIQTKQVNFPKNITAHSLDSKEYTGEGLNLFFVIYDEIAGFEIKKADLLYKALRSTARSRFPRYMKILLLSYKRNDNDYMMTRFGAAENEPTTYRSGPLATWEVNRKRTYEDFLEDYARDPEGSERTYECKGTTNLGGFLVYKTRISEVINAANKENPIIGDTISTVDLRGIQFKEWFKPEPHVEYYIHVDLAKADVEHGQDACGFAMSHFKRGMPISMPDSYISGICKTPEAIDAMKQTVGNLVTGVVLDLVLQIKAPASGEVMFEEIRAFIERLKKIEKFAIYKVTYDGFQSADSIQLLRKAGVNADEQSVDRDNRAYNTVKNVLYQGILEAYPHKILVRELEELRITPTGKIDHPEISNKRYNTEDKINRGSKDVADAAAGCISLAMERGRGGFSFGVSKAKGASQGNSPIQTIDPTMKDAIKHPLRFESERLVRRGEKPPEWYKNK